MTVKDLLLHPWMRGMTLERSQRHSADVARTIVALMDDQRETEDPLESGGIDALAALDEACAETNI